MANLTVMGPWVGPGEERTARFLESALPDAWEIVAGRKLPGEDRSDVDLIVIGSNLIFVVEEKAWGPSVVVGDERWWVGRDERRNPLNATAHKARVLAGLLKDRVGAFRNQVYAQRVVRPVVILSHERLTLTATKQAAGDELVLALQESAQTLSKMDAANASDLRLARDSVIRVLTDLAGRDARVTQLGPYRVVSEDASIGRIACFTAEHEDTGEEVLLRCFPISGWGDGDPSGFFRRETRALARLADENRTWRFHPPFEEEERSWFVVPVVPPKDRRNLAESVSLNDPARVDSTLPEDIAHGVIGDAFRGLAAIHEKHLLHRILCPARVWLGQGMRVHFSDFYLAKLDGEGTVVYWAQEDPASTPYRAPECADSLVFSTESSDVFSLALSLTCWWSGHLEGNAVDARQWLRSRGAIGELMAKCLADIPGDRPGAGEVVTALASAVEEERSALLARDQVDSIVEFAPGTTIVGRYQLRRKLGEGGSAISWLAYDDQRQMDVVIKQLRSVQIAELARQEFMSAQAINHPKCARVWDILDTPPPGLLVHEYKEGDSLKQTVQLGVLTVESARKIAVETLEVLQDLHDQGKVHGDVSPGNIVIDENSRPVLIDFGLMARIGDRPVGGTPSTMAPEILEGKTVSALSDVYSLACTLVQAMLGRPPYVGRPEEGAARDSKLSELTESEVAQWGDDGFALLRALFKGAEPLPENRPQSARDFAGLVRVARGKPGPTPADWTFRVNPTVFSLRTQYRGSRIGNAGNRGMDDPFAIDTYVPTRLDLALLPAVVAGDLDVVLLTGNPGDGKTSFLVAVRQALMESGARLERDDESGWLIAASGRTYAAVYDASESHEALSSDDLVHGALRPLDGGSHTALLAVNDGRLLQFFTDYRNEYPQVAKEVRRRMDGHPSANPRVALVDLKQRALAGYDGQGLALEIAAAFTDPLLWVDCSDCQAQEMCPILRNASELRGPVQAGIGELLLTSHLRRRRRATVRDVRSALAWMITGDRACEEVHEAVARGEDLTRASEALLADLAFSSESGDYLVAEWSELDPAEVIAPVVERRIRAENQRPGISIDRPTSVTQALRQAFLEAEGSSSSVRRELRSYRYLDEYLRTLQNPDEHARDRLLLGLSRIAGAPGYSDHGFAVGERHGGGRWAVLKLVDASEFELSAGGGVDPYIESIADTLRLVHTGPHGQGRANFPLTLDTAELILRAADGEILGDIDSEALRQEIEAFAATLRRQSADSALIVDPAGVAEQVVRRGTSLERTAP